jgi:hypothetical protein
MLSKGEKTELLKRIHDYALAEVAVQATADSSRRDAAIESAADQLERLLAYVEEIS